MAPAHAGDPALEVQTPRLLTAAEAFASETDALASVESKARAAHDECATKAKALYDRMRVWFPLLTRDMSTFAASAYEGTPEVVEDLISDGQSLVLMVSGQLPRLPYGERLIADLRAAVDALQTAYKAEHALRTERGQRKQAEDRTAAVLNQELVVYRRMLRRAVGPAHHHYRMLHRPGRADAEPPDDTQEVSSGEPAATPNGGSPTPAT